MKRKLIRISLMTIVPVAILFGGYHITYHMGQLTNYILMTIFGVKFALSLPITGIFGLIVLAVTLFLIAVVIKVLWYASGNVMEWYDSKMEQRRINRLSQFDSRVGFRDMDSPVPVPTTDRERMIRNILSPEGQAMLEEHDEVVDEDQQYRQRIGVEE